MGAGTDRLRDRRILVVEDDVLLALELQEWLQEAGAVVVGPASTLVKALRLSESTSVDAGVLDLRLGSTLSLPLADRLHHRGIPFLFQTSDPSILRGAHPSVPVLLKPCRPEQLIAAVAGLFRQ